MKSKTAILHRSLSLLLAVLIAMPAASLTVFSTGDSVSASTADLVSYNYAGLTDAEKAILQSGLVLTDTYTYTVPDKDDGLVTVDAKNRTVEAKAVIKNGHSWIPVFASVNYSDGTENIILNKNTSGDTYSGSYTYDENTYDITVTYDMSIPVSASVQSKLLNGPYYLVKGLSNLSALFEADFYLVSSTYWNTIKSLTDGSLPNGVKLTAQATVAAVNELTNQRTNNFGALDVELMLYDYEDASSASQFLFENGAALKVKALQTYGYINTICTDPDLEALIDSITDTRKKRSLNQAVNGMKKVITEIEDTVNDDWAILENENDPFQSGLSLSEYQTLDGLAANAGSAQYHDDEIKAELNVLPVVITENVIRHNVAVNVAAQTVATADSAELSDLPAHSITLKLLHGAGEDAILDEITSSGIEAEALSDWGVVDAQHYTRTASELPAALNEDITYTVSYTPKTYNITYDFAADLPTTVPYGYVMTLPIHGGEELVYDYYTANGAHYFEGETVKITADTAISRTEGKQWSAIKKNKITAEVYNDVLTEQELLILTSPALSCGDVRIRVPDIDDGLVEIEPIGENEYRVTAQDYASGITGLTWIPAGGYVIKNGIVADAFDLSDGAWSFTLDDFISVRIRYELDISDGLMSKAEALYILNMPKTLSDEAKYQIENMDILDGLYDRLGQIDQTTLNQIKIGVNGSDMADEAKEATKVILEQCVEQETEKLYLYEYLTGYREEGLSYYYKDGNYEKICEQIRIFNSNISIIYNDEGFIPLLIDMDYYDEYYEKIGEIIADLSIIDLTPPNTALNISNPELSDITGYIVSLIDNANTFDTANEALIVAEDIEIPVNTNIINLDVDMSVSLYENIAMNFKVQKELFDDGTLTDPHMQINFDGKNYDLYEFKETEDQLVFSLTDISPDLAAENASVKLKYKKDGEECEGKTVTCSISEYCETLINSAGYGENLKNLCYQLLVYSRAAQNYTGKTALDLCAYAAYENNIPYDSPTEESGYIKGEDMLKGTGNTDVKWKGASLSLEESISIRVKFEVSDIQGLTLEYKVGDGETQTVSQTEFIPAGDGAYYAYLTGISPAQMRETIEAAVMREGTLISKTLNYSIATYVKNMENNAEVGELVAAIMRYGDAAAAYVENPNG